MSLVMLLSIMTGLTFTSFAEEESTTDDEYVVPGDGTYEIFWSRLDSYSFKKYKNLKKAIMKEKLIVTNFLLIKEHAFSECSELIEVDLTKPNSKYITIEYAVFENCPNLVTVKFPEIVTKFDSYCTFMDCVSLRNVTLSENIDYIGSLCFYNCSSIQKINIPSNVRCVYESAFAKCESLTDIVLPEGLEELWGEAFKDCKSLKNIKIPSGIKTIKEGTFSGCSSLTNIDIPENVTKIDDYAYFGCTGTNKVLIPKTVEYIGSEAFGYTGSDTDSPEKIPGFTIYGYLGSAAEKYADENGFIFIPLDKKDCEHTDADNDGKCDSCGEDIVKDYLFYCSMCPTYEKMKNVPVVGIIYSVVHFFVHLAQMIGRIS